jgi:DNA gyrase subunit B
MVGKYMNNKYTLESLIKTDERYSGDAIKNLNVIEHCRKRPGMWIADKGYDGYHHLFKEMFDNCVDEYLAGYCKEIQVNINLDGSLSIFDNGRGIPTDNSKDLGMNTLTAIFTKPFTGGKFQAGVYKTSSGLNGVGAKLVNALSTYLEVNVFKNENIVSQRFEKGIPVTDVYLTKNDTGIKTGTKVTFLPDTEIFEIDKFDSEFLKARLRDISGLCPGLVTKFHDEEYKSDVGLKPILDHNTKHLESICSDFSFSSKISDLTVDLRFRYLSTSEVFVKSFVNTVHTEEDGSHVDAVIDSIIAALRTVVGKTFTRKQVLDGIGLVISLFYQDPIFRGQSKSKLSDRKVYNEIINLLSKSIHEFFETNKNVANFILEKVNMQERAVEEAQIKSSLKKLKKERRDGILPAKLSQAYGASPDKRELYLCEGESAAGCLSFNTKIMLLDGSLIEIGKSEELIGKDVLCVTDGKVDSSIVTDAFQTMITSDCVKLYLDNGVELICTPDHPILLQSEGFKRADSITIKDEIWSVQNITNIPKVVIKSAIHLIKREKYSETIPVYDVTVADSHNFMIEGGLCVHNTLRRARFPTFQEVLPLKGKVINAQRASLAQLMGNAEVSDIFLSIGGMQDSNTSLRTKNVFILADSDPDGRHISALIIAMFVRLFPSFIVNHNLFLVEPPLFTLESGDIRMHGNDRKLLIDRFKTKKTKAPYNIYRNKGLGEMNAEELRPLIDPNLRELIKLDLNENSVIEMEKLFGNLGDVRRALMAEDNDIDG